MRNRIPSYVDAAPGEETEIYLVLQDDAIFPRRMVNPLSKEPQEEFMEGKITKATTPRKLMVFLHEDRARKFMMKLNQVPEKVNLWSATAFGEITEGDRMQDYHSEFRAEYARPNAPLANLEQEKEHSSYSLR